ncbi:MAG TPA: LuxR C-terminal-related transcriptional regulator [Spirochaetia bacterium]|nr:LuxR C-terminal-related transcriptional regulator [Spirochaetia bacterium]
MQIPSDLREHTQLVFIYGTRRERWSVFSEFLLDGIEQGSAAVSVLDGRTAGELEPILRHAGPAHAPPVLFLAAEAFARDPAFLPSLLIKSIESAIEKLTPSFGGRIRLLIDMTVFVPLFHRTQMLNELHLLFRELVEAVPAVLLQGYFSEYLPAELSAGHFSSGALFLLSDSIRHAAYGAGDSDDHQDQAWQLDLALEQLILRGRNNLRAAVARRRVVAGGTTNPADGVSPRFLRHAVEGYLVMDPVLTVIYASPIARAILGDSPTDFRGVSAIDLLPAEAVHMLGAEVSVLVLRSRSGQVNRPDSVPSARFELSLQDGSGRTRMYDWTVKVIGAPPETYGILCHIREIDPSTFGRPTAGAFTAGARHGTETMRSRQPVHRELSISAGNGVTQREYQIIGLLMDGMQNKQIAEELGVAQVTVKKHLSNIYQKLNIKNRFELLRMTHWT